MKYQVMKSCRIHNETKNVGDVVELDDQMAKELLGIGRISPHHEPKVENRSVGLDDSPAAPKKRAKAKK